MPTVEGPIKTMTLGDRDLLISVSGELDLHTVGDLENALDEAIAEENEHIVVDLSDVSFVDSIALSVLAKSSRRLREIGGSLGVTTTNPEIVRPFEITGLDRLIPLERSVTELLERLDRARR